MSVYHHSSYLFFDGTQPMRFSMRPCDEREKLKPVVEHGGATITTKSTRDTIRLVPPGTIVNTDNCVSSKWIWDCVENNKKVPLLDYIVKQQSGSDISDIDDGDVSGPLRRRKPPKGTRRDYLLCDDMAIIDYLYDSKRLAEVKGRTLWQEMERAKICKGRSWQSLKERFNKQIVDNINSYNLTVKKIDYFAKKQEKGKKRNTRPSSSPTDSEISLNRKQARLYSPDEDIKLIYYVLDENEFESISGNVFWKKLAAKKIIERTWQSMKERFTKYITTDIKKYKIENEYREPLKCLLSHMGIDCELSTEVSDDCDEISVENDKTSVENDKTSVENDEISVENDEISVENDEISVEKDEILVESDEISVEKDEILVESDDEIVLELIKTEVVEDNNLETRDELESPDFQLRMEESDDSQVENITRNDSSLIETEKLSFANSESPEIGIAASVQAEIGAENTSKTNENENLLVLDYIPCADGPPKLQLSFYTSSEPERPQLPPDINLDEVLAKCVKSLKEEELDTDEDKMETNDVIEERFAETLTNFINLRSSGKPTNPAILSEIPVVESSKSDEPIAKVDDNTGKRKRLPENEDLDRKRDSRRKSPRNPREKMIQKQLLKKAARTIELMNYRSEPSAEESEEIFQIAQRLERIGEQQLDTVDLNIKTLGVLFGMAEDQIWLLLELFDFNRLALFEEIGYKIS